jgi:hypothetical protein
MSLIPQRNLVLGGKIHMKKVSKTATVTTPATPALEPAPKLPAKAAAKSTAKPKIAKAAAPLAPSIKNGTSASTTVLAQIDVGFGNTLFVRGEGPGLSWERGVPMDCVADDKWSISLHGADKPVVFKFLVNDLTWCAGDDFVAQPGSTLTVNPAF